MEWDGLMKPDNTSKYLIKYILWIILGPCITHKIFVSERGEKKNFS